MSKASWRGGLRGQRVLGRQVIGRRAFVSGLLGSALMAGLPVRLAASPPLQPAPGPTRGAPVPFSLDHLTERLKALVASPYQPPPRVGKPLAGLGYDGYRAINYRAEESLWQRDRSHGFQAQLFHPGYLFPESLKVFEVVGSEARELQFSPRLFTYDEWLPRAEILATAQDIEGFAGLRLHYPLNDPTLLDKLKARDKSEALDELAAFLGASYFRALGEGSHYGISARALALNMALRSGEIFPAFREFWLEQPGEKSNVITLHFLIDSPLVAGLYTMEIAPGPATVMTVTARLIARKEVEKLGLAPLTSMYAFGAMGRGDFVDFRPQVHDSDGLALWLATGERLWRPLRNPKRLSLSQFQAASVKGFGLLQRSRDFALYQDVQARYDLRPSLWVEPLEDWGKGRVELLELPTLDETADNIAAAFVPEEPLRPGQLKSYRYRLYWGEVGPAFHKAGQALYSFSGYGGPPGGATGRRARQYGRKFVIDFVGEGLAALHSAEGIAVSLTASAGRCHAIGLYKNEVAGGLRLSFDYEPEKRRAAELRCFLHRAEETLTETWSYLTEAV